jgi:hypothetical protein
MSRSRRKTPVAGVTAAPSDRPSKVASNRAHRQAVKQSIATDPETPPPTMAQAMDRWSMAKEGKIRFDPRESPKRMRK